MLEVNVKPLLVLCATVVVMPKVVEDDRNTVLKVMVLVVVEVLCMANAPLEELALVV